MKTINYNNNYNTNETLNIMIKVVKERLAVLTQENNELKQQVNILTMENSELKHKNENMRNELYKRGYTTSTTLNEDMIWQSFLNEFTEPYESERRKNILETTRATLRNQIESTRNGLIDIYNLINELGELL